MDQTLLNPTGRHWPFILLRAIAAIAFGVIALLLPAGAMVALVLLFAAYMLADGVLAAVAGVRAARAGERWGWFALEAVVDILAGVVALLWPGLTVVVFVLLVAAWALVSGAVMLWGAWRFRPEHGRVWLVLGGLVSLALGVVLALWPAAGALALTLWLGAYALVFGVMLLVLAFQLRRRDRPA